jgi:hypothetical protein
MSVATVVGMVVSIQKADIYKDTTENLEKSYLTFPDAKEMLACFHVKIHMLDG